MISIFHFCFTVNTSIKLQENIIIASRDSPKVVRKSNVVKKKTVILDSYIK